MKKKLIETAAVTVFVPSFCIVGCYCGDPTHPAFLTVVAAFVVSGVTLALLGKKKGGAKV